MHIKTNKLAMADGGIIFGFCDKLRLFPNLRTESQDNDDCDISS